MRAQWYVVPCNRIGTGGSCTDISGACKEIYLRHRTIRISCVSRDRHVGPGSKSGAGSRTSDVDARWLSGTDVNGKHAAAMGGSDEGVVHPEQFINRTVGGAIIAGRPTLATVSASENTNLSSDIQV